MLRLSPENYHRAKRMVRRLDHATGEINPFLFRRRDRNGCPVHHLSFRAGDPVAGRSFERLRHDFGVPGHQRGPRIRIIGAGHER